MSHWWKQFLPSYALTTSHVVKFRHHSVAHTSSVMVSNRCLMFDLLPVELIHTLFGYFWSDEILHSFFNLNDHFNAIILSYYSHKFNFQSIVKRDFDTLCRLIRPIQVISLTLSDGNDTPEQSTLFFSHFHIEPFVHLRSLSLLNIGLDSLKSILFNLNKLPQLCALSIYCDNTVRNIFITTRRPLDSLLSHIASNVLLQLNRLRLGNGIDFKGNKINDQ